MQKILNNIHKDIVILVHKILWQGGVGYPCNVIKLSQHDHLICIKKSEVEYSLDQTRINSSLI